MPISVQRTYNLIFMPTAYPCVTILGTSITTVLIDTVPGFLRTFFYYYFELLENNMQFLKQIKLSFIVSASVMTSLRLLQVIFAPSPTSHQACLILTGVCVILDSLSSSRV